MIIQNKGYSPGLALGRRGVSSVSQWWLWDLLLHKNLLLVLLDHLLMPALRRSRTHPTCSLHACNDDVTLSIFAIAALKLRIYSLSS